MHQRGTKKAKAVYLTEKVVVFCEEKKLKIGQKVLYWLQWILNWQMKGKKKHYPMFIFISYQLH